MYHFVNEGLVSSFLIFSIPIIAIVGGITAGIVRTLSRHRIIELAQRERIAAIERGIDPSKLPPLPVAHADFFGDAGFVRGARHRAQGLLVAGLITIFAGAGVSLFLLFLADQTEHGVWAVGLIPGFIGIAMLISAAIVWPRGGDADRPGGTTGQ